MNGNPYRGEPADVWSTGVVLFALLVGSECHSKALLPSQLTLLQILPGMSQRSGALNLSPTFKDDLMILGQGSSPVHYHSFTK